MNHQQLIDNWARWDAAAQLNNAEAWLAELAAAKARVAELERTAAEYASQMAAILLRAEQAEARVAELEDEYSNYATLSMLDESEKRIIENLNGALRERCELLSRAVASLWQLLSEEHRQLLAAAINVATTSTPEPADS